MGVIVVVSVIKYVNSFKIILAFYTKKKSNVFQLKDTAMVVTMVPPAGGNYGEKLFHGCLNITCCMNVIYANTISESTLQLDTS